MIALFVARAVAVGVVGVVSFDLWGWALERVLRIRAPRWGILGRWLTRPFVPQAARIPGIAGPYSVTERIVGTAAHFSTGVMFAVALLLLVGNGWLVRPVPLPAIAFGIGTVVFTWFVIMPALGAGVAGATTPSPSRARVLSLASHTVLGMGFYIGALLAARFL